MNPYQYVVLRCVPRVEREEFVNVGVVLHCPEESYLAMAGEVDDSRIHALAPGLDLDAVRAALDGIDRVCRGEAHTGLGLGVRATAYGVRETVDDLGTRFGLIKAPRSTVLQPGPVHGGMTSDAAGTLARLLESLVR